MNLLFDIFSGIGVAAAVGIRPFLPGLLVAGFAAAGIETKLEHSRFEFLHTSLSFLQSTWFLVVLAVLAIVLLVGENRFAKPLSARAGLLGLALVSAVLAALLVGGEVCANGHAMVLGIALGAVFGVLGALASQPFLLRLRRRLDPEAAAVGVPLVAEGAGLIGALASVLVPPLGIVVVLALLFFAARGRGRDDQKYAGLRILR